MTNTILRIDAVKARTGLSRSTIYQRISEGSFPKPILLGGNRAIGWPSSDIDIFINALIASKTKEEIRALVKELVAARASCFKGPRNE